MNYIPLHHKYRPQTFSQLVGQEMVATTLANGMRLGRVMPAYLFCGPRGTGKTSSARILAKALNCLSTATVTPEPCGTCDLCRGIVRGAALDVLEIDAASNTGVDNVRDLIEGAQYAPVQGRYKVFIIDECHMLSTAAFNALLKTLEEPPPHAVFILATTDPQRLPATIISRCQRFDFRRISLERMTAHLATIAQQEGIEITPEALTLVAQLAQGGMRDAESLLDQLSLLPPPVNPDQVWQLVGSVPERPLLALLQSVYTQQPLEVMAAGRQLLDQGWEPLAVLHQLVALYRDLLIARVTPAARHLTTLTEATWEALVALAQTLPVDTILAAQAHLRTSEPQVRHAPQPHLWLEVTLLGLLPSQTPPPAGRPPSPAPLPPVSAAPAATPAPPQPAPPAVSPPAPASPPPVSPPAVAPEPSPPTAPEPPPPAPPAGPDLGEIWATVVSHIQKKASQSLFQGNGQLLTLQQEPPLARVGFQSPALVTIAQGKLKELQTAFKRSGYGPLQIEIVPLPAAPTPAARPAVAPPPPLPPPAPTATRPSPVQPPPAASSSEPKAAPPTANPESEVWRAARRLADFFQGDIVLPAAEADESHDSEVEERDSS
ncbi:MAG: DNA polymerase III subunit gamma/tau [Gloeomargaritaceae cyanobacterium C42_A2020_066]|nr:DNA polymerase III subunit gamma/tau [Gloeomargaritaceae cyanobacterium C42_A2020_066]